VVEYLEAFRNTEDFKLLKEEFDFITNYKEAWQGAPYLPSFLCCDAVVIRSGHVLVIKRKSSPGKGLWALPGGFVGQDERIMDAAVRELKEETSIALSKDELRRSITESKVCDDPLRSLRGRTVSVAYCFNLGHGALPKVKGADDAIHAKWLPIDQALSQEHLFFEDHHAIIQHFVSRT
jgi:bifunctional NMN adenylyltransferase/nudix hydrolase